MYVKTDERVKLGIETANDAGGRTRTMDDAASSRRVEQVYERDHPALKCYNAPRSLVDYPATVDGTRLDQAIS